ncbi:MAG: T9SS type A sorting domain-containing protein [Bacteroidales bacterium]|nr:T9SS type A sorting domain-containing protein [Bacteroidales bacterium]
MKKEKLLKDSLKNRLVKYSAAAGAVIAISSNADAQIAYSGLQNLTFNTHGTNPIDLDGDGTNDFTFGLQGFMSLEYAGIQNLANNSWIGGSNFVYALSTNYNINSAQKWTTNNIWYNLGYYNSFGTNRGNFLNVGDKYIGVKFEINSGEYHYGWILINLNANSTSLVVKEWAYEKTKDVEIKAGDISDITAPTVALTTVATEPVNGEFDITITFSEETTGLLENEIVVTNGSVKTGSLVTVDAGITYTATITPVASGDVTIAVPANVAQDAATNDNEAATNLVVEADLDAPTVALTTLVTEPVNGEFDITITFSEETAGLLENEIVVTNGTVKTGTLVTADAGLTYTATIAPTASGDVTITLPANVAQDAAANNNEAATNLIVEADLNAPTVALTTLVTEPVGGEFDITITFSEETSGLLENEINVTNGSVKASSLVTADLGLTYTATIAPTASGDVTIALPANVAQDAAANNNEAATNLVVEADIDAPTVALTTLATEPVNGEFDITITFSEETTGLLENEINVTNGSVKASSLVTTDAGITYTATIVPTASGDVTIALPANVAQDAATNNNEAATNLVVEADLDAPTVALTTLATEPVNGDFDISITFNEVVSALNETDITVSNGTLKAFSTAKPAGPSVYTATITPTASGNITIAIAEGVIQDAAGNDNEAATNLVVKADLDAPTVALTTIATEPVGGEFDITITFNEKTTGLLENEIVVTNGSVKANSLVTANAGLTYTTTIIPVATGNVTIALPANIAQDAAGNENEAATNLVIEFEPDIVAPTVTVVTAVTEPVGGEFDITITFSEKTTGLLENEIVVTNGSVKASSLVTANAGLTYTATIIPVATGNVTIALPANIAQDAAGNENEAATNLVIEFEPDIVAPTVTVVTAVTEPVSGEFDITITFSEETTGLLENEIAVTNGSVKTGSLITADAGLTYSATIAPTASGDITIALPENIAQDAAGNDNEAATNLVVEADLDAPTVVLTTLVTEPVSGEFDITITFSEETTGLLENEIVVTNGSVKTSTLATADAGLTYTATIAPTASGNVTIALSANVAQDDAGNVNEAAIDMVVVADITSGIENLPTDNEILVYPNPTTGNMKIDLINYELDVKSIVITDLSGRLIHNQNVKRELVDLDLSSYKKGMYILIMQTDTNQITKKIVIK